LATAVFLAQHGVRTTVVERRAGTSIHPRALHLGLRAAEVLQGAGLTEHLLAVQRDVDIASGRIDVERIDGTDFRAITRRIPQPSAGAESFSVYTPARTGNISQDRLDTVLLSAARARGVIVSFGTELESIEQDGDGVRATVRDQGGGHPRTIAADYLIGADGAKSAVRQSVGLTADISDFNETAIVATVATERSHEKTAWQRFMRNGTLAFLPLADGTSSIVWSADNALATDLAAMSPTEFETALNRASDLALGSTRLVSERIAFPLKRVGAHNYVTQRCALIGDAAHVVHPLAGQGVNLGLLDAATLAQLILDARVEREDPGALRVLRKYERWRKSEVAFMSTAIEAFDRFLAHGSGPLSRLAQRGLGWVNRSQEIKRLFVNRALGVAGELPRAAR